MPCAVRSALGQALQGGRSRRPGPQLGWSAASARLPAADPTQVLGECGGVVRGRGHLLPAARGVAQGLLLPPHATGAGVAPAALAVSPACSQRTAGSACRSTSVHCAFLPCSSQPLRPLMGTATTPQPRPAAGRAGLHGEHHAQRAAPGHGWATFAVAVAGAAALLAVCVCHMRCLVLARLSELPPPAGVDDMAELLFYTDTVHPSGLTGHRAIAEIAWQLLNETLGWAPGPFTGAPARRAWTSRPLARA